MQMRAITDWYHTAHPPIMHDLHESLTLLYTYSGGPPQNPNLDPLLFSELPWFSNFELSQFNKFGMPGVYTHAFMDGWSPGYLGSVAYNHNGMMRMYETQSGRETTPAQVVQRVSVPGGEPGARGAAGGAAGREGGAAAPATPGAEAAGGQQSPAAADAPRLQPPQDAAQGGRGGRGAPGRGGRAGAPPAAEGRAGAVDPSAA